MKRFRKHLAILAIACGTIGQSVFAQEAEVFPNKPVRIIVPAPAGGASDSAARQVAQALVAAWGQQVIVENKPGASGAVAAQVVLGARSDGYTLLWGQGSMAGLAMVQRNSPFRSLGEFAPVVNVVQFGFAMFANKDLPFKSVAEFATYGKANPGKLNYATGSLGEYMAGTHVLEALAIQAVRIPYKGGVQLMPDLISGQVQINFGPIQSGISHVKAGKLKVIATLQSQRSALLPDVPTFTEYGVSAGNTPTWNGIFAPPGTPSAITENIASAVNRALKAPAVRSALEQQGAEPLGGTPQQLAAAVEAATATWQAFVRNHAIPQE